MTQRKQVEIFTDGACSGNPGPGGYGAILRYRGVTRELSGGDASTTNNRMELTAVITALSALKEPCDVTLCSDSKYIIDAVEKGWAKKWQQNGWMRNKKEPALNADLWAPKTSAATGSLSNSRCSLNRGDLPPKQHTRPPAAAPMKTNGESWRCPLELYTNLVYN